MGILKTVADQITALSDALNFERRDLKADLGVPWHYVKSSVLNSHFKWYCRLRGYSKLCFGETYDTLLEEERKEFIDRFSTFIRVQSLNKFDIYRIAASFRISYAKEDTITFLTS